MRLKAAHIWKYRSIRDTEAFEIEPEKTILVGANEAGKTVVLRALQQLNPPPGTPGFTPLRDYPRSELNDITSGRVIPDDVRVVTGEFSLEPDDIAEIPAEYKNCTYVVHRSLTNKPTYELPNAPLMPRYSDVKNDLLRLAAYVDGRAQPEKEGAPKPSTKLGVITQAWTDQTVLFSKTADPLEKWLAEVLPLVDEDDEKETKRHDRLSHAVRTQATHNHVAGILHKRLPVFVYFSNYFRVHPRMHLRHLADRIEQKLLDDEQYDYGNKCLLQLLGFTAKELSDLGEVPEPKQDDIEAFKRYQDQLDERAYKLNAAQVRLTEEIRNVWRPDKAKDEAATLRITADRQYLKVVVEDELGVDIELDQRSEGFQWLVSFFIVFFAEAADKYKNAILLLDEPGLSLHGLKQREFRQTISRLAKENQTIFTTHSPFLVGPSELDLVRVVEMTDRRVGTKVHTTLTAKDPKSLLPLQEALGYDLAQSLFSQKRNLVLEGLADYWYVDGVANLLREGGLANLNESLALVPAASAGKVVYYATLLFAQNLKVAALLDSDSAGDQAAEQEILVHTLGNKNILRTKDVYIGSVKTPEIEDLLRETLVAIAKDDLGWDVTAISASQPLRPIVDIFKEEISHFSKYKLAKAFLRWVRASTANDLTVDERTQLTNLMESINKALK